MLKKSYFITLLAIIMIAFTLTACSEAPISDAKSSPANSPAQTSEVKASPSSSPAATPSSTQAPDTKKGVERGRWESNTFSSKFLPLELKLPEKWLIVSDSDLAGRMGVSVDTFGDKSDKSKWMAECIKLATTKSKWMAECIKLATIYDTVIEDPSTGNSISVVYENLAITGSSSITEQGYFEAIQKQMENTKTFKTFNFTYGKPYSAKLGSIPFTVVQCNDAERGFNLYYFMHKENSYMTVVVVTLADKTKIEDIIAQFK